jgi:3-hydroxyisobutyrate dehydrogenase
MSERIAFVGVGRMGANMARRLKDCGDSVTAVYDVHRPTADELAREIGAVACRTLAEVTAAADVVFTVVTDDKSMKAIFEGRRDNLLIGAAGRVFVNCATLSPKVHRVVEKLAARAKAQTLEACMASSIPQARQGTLYLMCGGKESVFERLKPMLTKLTNEGATLRYIGGAGRAAEVKALVNMVMNINTAALAEGLALGSALGLDLTMLREVFSQTGANSRVLQTDGEDMQNRDHSCFFSAAHAAKDSGIALALGREKKLNLPLATATLRQFQCMVKEGLGGLDKSGIAELTFKGRHKARTPRAKEAKATKASKSTARGRGR